jgi:hypothetical protein
MKSKYIIWGVVIIIGIIIAFNYQSIFKSVVPPHPIIVSSKADGSSSKLFEYSVKVSGSVRNDGGDGSIVVEVVLFQGNNSWKKTKQLYLPAYETENFEIIFDEAKLFDTDPKYYIKAFPVGSLNK